MRNLWYLESVNLFKMLCPHKFGAYKDSHTFNDYKKEDYIYFVDDTSNKVYLITHGKVKLGYYTEQGDEIVKAILTKGEVFGENSILGNEKHTEFAKSINNNTTICPIDANTLQGLIRDNKSFALGFYKFMDFRIKKLERRLKILLYKDTKTRFVEFLKEMCEEYGIKCDDTGLDIIQHPYTQKEIAALIGTSRPTLNITMNELKEDGIIDFHQKTIKILKKIA
ncbi:MAG: Crp/Fnr family transcriptional regulator [Flavobacteriaceae bacterium]|nr:Crp/Fnr family transcriptional regulator [Flavobacteriaceae bacterium]